MAKLANKKITKVRNQTGATTTNLTEVKKDYKEILWITASHYLGNLSEILEILKKIQTIKNAQVRSRNLNRPIKSKEIEIVIIIIIIIIIITTYEEKPRTRFLCWWILPNE